MLHRRPKIHLPFWLPRIDVRRPWRELDEVRTELRRMGAKIAMLEAEREMRRLELERDAINRMLFPKN